MPALDSFQENYHHRRKSIALNATIYRIVRKSVEHSQKYPEQSHKHFRHIYTVRVITLISPG